MNSVVEAYRKAAIEAFGANEAEASKYIVAPEDDPGENSPRSAAIIYLEPDMRFPEDTGVIPAMLDYYQNWGVDNCFMLDEVANCGHFIEYVNPAVAAVWPV